MSNERGQNKKKREKKKIDRLQRLLGIDFCACAGGHKLKCQGCCRENHVNPKTGRVECGELYQIERSEAKQSGPRRPKRDWKFGRQKEGNENKQNKQDRKKKIDRDKS